MHSRIVDGTLGVSPRPVFYEELDLLVKETGVELSEEELAAVSGGVRGVKCEFNYCEGFEPGA